MDPATTILIFVGALAALLGAVASWFVAGARWRADSEALRARLLEEGKARAAAEEKARYLSQVDDRLGNAFKALSAEALRDSGTELLKLARASFESSQSRVTADVEVRKEAIGAWVKELRESVERIEKERAGTFGKLEAQLQALAQGSLDLRRETGRLVQALKTPHVRGRWGEVQLRNVVSHCGMLEYCDFVEQESVRAEGGNLLRPDLVVRLPGRRSVVVDAKVSLMAYLEAIEAEDETVRRQKLRQHAAQLRAHVDSLSSKQYWAQFEDMPQFVFAFVPNEATFAAALQEDGTLIEYATSKKVILATPSTLVTLLLVSAGGWREARLAENAARISEQGKLLYERLGTYLEHFDAMRGHLDKAVEKFNQASSSLGSRVLPAARKMKELGLNVPEELPLPGLVERVTREPTRQTPEPGC